MLWRPTAAASWLLWQGVLWRPSDPSGPHSVLGGAGLPLVGPLLLYPPGSSNNRAACGQSCLDLCKQGGRTRRVQATVDTSLPSWDTAGSKNSQNTALHADHFTNRFAPGGVDLHQEQLHHEAADPKFGLCFGQLGGANCLSMVCEGLPLTEAAREGAAGVAIEEVRGLPPPPAALMPGDHAQTDLGVQMAMANYRSTAGLGKTEVHEMLLARRAYLLCQRSSQTSSNCQGGEGPQAGSTEGQTNEIFCGS